MSKPTGPWSGRRLAFRIVGMIVALVVLYFGVTLVQVWMASRSDDAREAEAIIVLGAAQYDGTPSPVLEARLDHAIALYDDGYADVVVVTGGRQKGDRFTEATAAAAYLHEAGVPESDIRREVTGESSYESIAASARFLEEEDIDDVLLVSDPYHAKRIAAIASEVGLTAYVSPAETDQSWRSLLRETAAVGVGRLVGHRRLGWLADAL